MEKIYTDRGYLVLFKIHRDLASRTLGGFSLMVLAR
jgi:hypothetical protein